LVAEIKQKYQEALKIREKQRRKQERTTTSSPKSTTLEGPQPPADSLNEKFEKTEQQTDVKNTTETKQITSWSPSEIE